MDIHKLIHDLREAAKKLGDLPVTVEANGRDIVDVTVSYQKRRITIEVADLAWQEGSDDD